MDNEEKDRKQKNKKENKKERKKRVEKDKGVQRRKGKEK